VVAAVVDVEIALDPSLRVQYEGEETNLRLLLIHFLRFAFER
jgi:hypothetical protein